MPKIKSPCTLVDKHVSPSDVTQGLEKILKRKNDTRKKILVGAYILDKYKKEGTTEILKAELDAFLTRKQDRVLFGL